MIRYAMRCAAGHRFDAWFRSSGDCEMQEARHAILCPQCGDTQVCRDVMAPNVRLTRGDARREAPDITTDPAAQHGAAPVAAGLQADPQMRELQAALKELRDHVRAKAEYVGPRFAEEARRIHFGEAPQRGIFGEATPREVSDLVDDGVDVLPLPHLPDDLS